MHTPVATPPHPSFREALNFWFRLGWISFGGPAGQIALMHDYLVDKKRWISPSRFLHALNYCMLLPGPEAQQLATYSGWLLHGVRGGIAAGVLFVLPSALILWVLSVVYVWYGQLPAIQAIFDFLKPAIVAIVAGAIIKIGKKSLQTPLHYLVAALAFAAIYFFNIPFPLIVLGAIAAGAGAYFFQKKRTSGDQAVRENEQETDYIVHREIRTLNAGFSGARLLRQLGIAGLLWLLPFGLLFVFAADFTFWKKLTLFFTQAALVTFGGAYAVLPYVAQVSVEKFGWLSQLQMIDGLALGETTPGPLIMVLAFVGFMAAFNASAGSIAAATLGLGATVYYTFLPSFVFILIGAPLIERTHGHPGIRAVLQYATAAVAGVMLRLCIYLAQAVIAPGWTDIRWIPLFWTLISIAALQYFKVKMIPWIALSAAAGLLFFMIKIFI